jgi:uncharacterized protein (DUF885 family)
MNQAFDGERPRVDQAFDAYLGYVREHAPAEATHLGDHSRDGELDDWGPETVDARIRAIGSLRRELDRMEPHEDGLLLRDTVDRARFELAGLRLHATDPAFYLGLATDSVYELIRRRDLQPGPRQAAVVSRTEQVPRLLHQARALLTDVPAPQREVALLRSPGAAALFRETVPAFAPKAAPAAAAAAAACEAFAAWLDDTDGGPAADWRLGERRWPEALRFALGVDLVPGEVWKRAQRALEHLQEQAVELARRVVGDAAAAALHRRDGATALVRAALDEVAADRAERDKLVDAAGGVLEEIRDFLRATDLFDLPEPDTLSLEPVPPFQQGVAVAFFVPAPPLEPHAAHTYYLSPIPAEWDHDRAESFLREYNLATLRAVGIHEAYPGHYVHFAHVHRHERPLRRMLWNPAFTEGWAVYVTNAVVAAGFGGTDAERARLQLTNIKLGMRSVANALLDQGLHLHGWGDAEAMRLMVDRTYQESAEAVGKLLRGKVTAGQLSTYFVGWTEMDDLRRGVERAQGTAFDPREFHRAVLAEGAPTFAALRRALLG